MTDQPDNRLQQFIMRQIEEGEGLDFASFMAHALYHPEFGYYMKDRARIGKKGDFFTSSSVHALFGALIARQLRQMWDLLNQVPFTIVEQGAGEGHLAKDILDFLKQEESDFYHQLSYQIVEVSPDNRRRQAGQLADHAERVAWTSFAELASFTGCYLSNELIDAFPVHIVEKRDDVFHEVHVVNTDDGFGEEFRPDAGRLKNYFDWLGSAPCEGNRGEANLAAIDWVREVAHKVEKGFVLTIDYGYPSNELYAPFRRNGTLMCYYKHSSNDDPYSRVGEQDMTTHVDFGALQLAGAEEQLEVLYFAEQYRFLLALGFVEQLMLLQSRISDEREAAALRMTLKSLIMPDEGMGSTFKVLIQGKGVGTPELLCQRRIADIPIPAA